MESYYSCGCQTIDPHNHLLDAGQRPCQCEKGLTKDNLSINNERK